MNIKGVVNNILPLDVVKVDRKKTDQTRDREPNQGGEGGAPPQQHKFTDEELKKALDYLRDLPGIKSNNLQLRVENHDDGRIVVFVEDISGKVIRRIPNNDLWQLTKDRQNTGRGHLLNKAM